MHKATWFACSCGRLESSKSSSSMCLTLWLLLWLMRLVQQGSSSHPEEACAVALAVMHTDPHGHAIPSLLLEQQHNPENCA
jgi:hypothetical protein